MASRVVSLALALALVLPACSESHTVDFDAAPVRDGSFGGRDSGPSPRDGAIPSDPDSGPIIVPLDTGTPPRDGGGRCGELLLPCCMGGVCAAGLACDPSTALCVETTVTPPDSSVGDVDGGGPIDPDAGPVTPLCGVPGAACCADGSCEGGACCDSTVCVRTGGALASGEVCRAGVPTACGGAGEACCDGGACDAGGCCVSGSCRMEGLLCGMVTTCMAGHCESAMFTCGGDGDPCCSTGGGSAPFCTASGLVCTGFGGGATCEACGGPGQPCCNGQACGGGACCVDNQCVGVGDSCGDMLGSCVGGGCNDGACGVIGDPCCDGGIGCPGPYAVCGGADVCVACGGDGQPCCGNTCLLGYVCGGFGGMRSCRAAP